MDGPSRQQAVTTRHESRIASARRWVQGDHGTHLLDHLSVVSKYRRVALSVLLLVVLGSLLRTYTTTPLYRAQARLMIEMEDERTAAMGSAISSSGSSLVLAGPQGLLRNAVPHSHRERAGPPCREAPRPRPRLRVPRRQCRGDGTQPDMVHAEAGAIGGGGRGVRPFRIDADQSTPRTSVRRARAEQPPGGCGVRLGGPGVRRSRRRYAGRRVRSAEHGAAPEEHESRAWSGSRRSS